MHYQLDKYLINIELKPSGTIVKIVSLVVILVITQTILLHASSNTSGYFMKANALYSEKRYEEAALIYKELIDAGYNNFELYYNLGNCYYQQNKLPYAILNYERAKKIAPNDEELMLNLNIANAKIIDIIEPLPKFFLIAWYESIRNSYSSSSWTIISIVSFCVSLIGLAGFLYFGLPIARKLFFASAAAVLALSIGSFIFAGEMQQIENNRDTAIIISPSITIKNSPDDNSTSLFTLHEGTKVKILDSIKNWNKVRIANGNIGWLPKSAIETI